MIRKSIIEQCKWLHSRLSLANGGNAEILLTSKALLLILQIIKVS